MNAEGNNTNVNIYDPVRDAVEINAQHADIYMHEMRNGSGNDRMGFYYTSKYSQVNALLGN